MAFLFGSQAKGYARKVSDWDVAVYVTEERRELEKAIWSEVEGIVGAEVDLVVLNRAPASIAWSIVRAGMPLIIKNRRLFLRFMIRVSHEANAWYRTSGEYHRIFERSLSLSEEDREHLVRTVQFLEQEIVDYKKFKQLTWQEYSTDRVKKREVERWAEQLVNAVIDVAEIILASERRVIPETYRMIILTLGTVAPFNQGELGEKLSQWTDLRNILAHEYLDYRWKEISAFIQETESLWHLFVEHTKKFLKER